MTEDGSFIINGADRVIVSQIHRSPGVYFTPDPARPGRYIASIIPLPKRGPWIDLEVEPNGVVSMKVNKRKFPLVLLLRVLGYDQETLARELGAYGELVQGLMDESVFAMRPEEALIRLFTLLRPGDPPKRDKAVAYVYGLIADPRRYDLGEAGRYKAEEKLGIRLSGRTLARFEDGEFKDEVFLPTLRYLFALTAGVPGHEVDDIDHLGNRRIRTVGELMTDQFRVGLARLARGVRERMLMGSEDSLTPAKLVNSRPLEAAIREFFSRSQLSQFKDETNPSPPCATSGGSPPWARAASPGSGRGLTCATSTAPTTGASAPWRPPRAPTSASSPPWRPTPGWTSWASSAPPTAGWWAGWSPTRWST